MLVVSALAGGGCSDLEGYELGEDEVFRGTVVGVRGDPCPAGECSFIRRGFPPGTSLEFNFRPQGIGAQPGTLSTSGEPCGPTFSDTPLRAIAPLQHDALAELQFPGTGRLRNFIFTARPTDGPLQGRDAMVFVSLLRGDEVEVRIIVGSGAEVCNYRECAAVDAGACDYFGVFRLRRQSR